MLDPCCGVHHAYRQIGSSAVDRPRMLGPHFTAVDQSAEYFERAVERHGVSLGVLVDLAIRQQESGDWLVSSKWIVQVLATVAVVVEQHQKRTRPIGDDADDSTRFRREPGLMRACVEPLDHSTNRLIAIDERAVIL